MNRITAFQNPQEFNEIFGMVRHGNGVVSRKNKILLAFYKSKSVWEYVRFHDEYDLWFGIKTMQTLFNTLIRKMHNESYNLYWHSNQRYFYCELMGNFWTSRKYEIDGQKGICLDGTSVEEGYIRYLNREKDTQRPKAYKMAAGKFFQRLILETEIGQALPQQVVVWMCEQLVERWKVYAASQSMSKYELHVDDEFGMIYDSYHCRSGFDSCMVDRGVETFYSDAVEAKAAYLTDEHDKIIARCVIFTNAIDKNGKRWRLAERQYAENGSDLKKRMLVNALIAGGHIDAYKRVGSGCCDSCDFVDNDGNDISDHEFEIHCDLKRGDAVSYQDSFKWYDLDSKTAYNYENGDAPRELDTTEGEYFGGSEWDEYHGEYCDEIRYVMYHGREISCDVDRLEDFIWFEPQGEYYHYDDLLKCEWCGEYYLNPRFYSESYCEYSELTGEHYCSESCLEEAEIDYKEQWWWWCQFDDTYVEFECELAYCYVWDGVMRCYHRVTVNKDMIDYHVLTGKLIRLDSGVLVDNLVGVYDECLTA